MKVEARDVQPVHVPVPSAVVTLNSLEASVILALLGATNNYQVCELLRVSWPTLTERLRGDLVFVDDIDISGMYNAMLTALSAEYMA